MPFGRGGGGQSVLRRPLPPPDRADGAPRRGTRGGQVPPFLKRRPRRTRRPTVGRRPDANTARLRPGSPSPAAVAIRTAPPNVRPTRSAGRSSSRALRHRAHRRVPRPAWHAVPQALHRCAARAGWPRCDAQPPDDRSSPDRTRAPPRARRPRAAHPPRRARSRRTCSQATQAHRVEASRVHAYRPIRPPPERHAPRAATPPKHRGSRSGWTRRRSAHARRSPTGPAGAVG
jgi:hypothetical protein